MSTTATDFGLADLSDVIAEQMEAWQVPGLAIGILRDGSADVAAYGVANVETGVDARPETLCQIGSISKIFTTTLVLILVDEGKLDLDAPVVAYVPDLPLAGERARDAITIRHLLTHMAGFYGDRFDDHGRGDDALARAVAAFHDLPQQTVPGELWTYCNAGFDLAGRACELVTGQGFEALVRERVFAPLGMERATYFPDEAILHAVAVGHTKAENGPRVASPWPIPRRSNPAGGVCTNVPELLRFARMHLRDGELDGKRVLSAESARAMRTLQVEADPFRTWGIGWSRREIEGRVVVEHNGATNGFTARLTLVPDAAFAIAILTNGSYGGAVHTRVSDVALEQLLGLNEPDRPVIALPEEALREIAGTYTHRLGDYTLAVKDGGFDVTRVNRNPFSGETSEGEPFRLLPVSDGVFLGQGGGTDGNYADVIRSADGSIRFLRFGGRLGYPAAEERR